MLVEIDAFRREKAARHCFVAGNGLDSIMVLLIPSDFDND